MNEEKDKEYLLERQNMRYKELFIGWCDYPEQFIEKYPEFKGSVKYQKITRIENPEIILKNYEDYSSKYVNVYYIGNYKFEYDIKFSIYDGTNENYNGVLIPKIDKIWEFSTNRFPFDDYI